MLRAALTGGIASGKSTIGGMFRQLGAHVIESDHMARLAVEPPSPLLPLLAKTFGPEVLDKDGRLRRKFLREIVFKNQEARKQLNALLHPHIEKMLLREASRISDPDPVIIFDIPLLFEIGWQNKFPVIILVYTPPDEQLKRLMERDSINMDEAEAALSAQWPIDKKKQEAHFIIDNSGLLSETLAQVQNTWNALQKISANQPG